MTLAEHVYEQHRMYYQGAMQFIERIAVLRRGPESSLPSEIKSALTNILVIRLYCKRSRTN